MSFLSRVTTQVRLLTRLIGTFLLALLLLNPLHATEPESPKTNAANGNSSSEKALQSQASKAATTVTPDAMDGYRVNVNRAGLEELQQLKGIGITKAKAIIEYRENNGKIDSLEELTQVSGIGEKFIEHNADNVSF